MGEAGKQALDQLLSRTKIEIVEMNEQQIQLAHEAWRKFGVATPQNLTLATAVHML